MKHSYILLFLVWVWAGCTKYPDAPPYFEEINTEKTAATKRVLFIGVDGAVGSIVKQLALPTLTAMQQHSKFSYESMSDEVTTDAASWKTLLSGVSYSKHKVSDSSFAFTYTGGVEDHDNVKQYVSIFTNLMGSEKGDLKTAVLSPWNNLVKKLTPEVENGFVGLHDKSVKDSAKKLLAQPITPAITIVNFNSPALAGRAGGFEASDVGYKEALLQTDDYIGELLKTIKARPEYNKSEEWLIIVGSTHGGDGNSYGGNGIDETNTFMFFYNERFLPTELTKEGTFSTHPIFGTEAEAVRAVLNDPKAYDISMAPITYQFKIKAKSPSNYPIFFTKRFGLPNTNTKSSAYPGLAFVATSSNFEAWIRGSSNAGHGVPKNIWDSKWHDVATIFTDSGSIKLMKIYVDGELYRYANISAQGATWAAFKSESAITVGYKRGDFVSAINGSFSDFRVFNTALTQAEIIANLCTQNPLKNHSKKDHLVGYWPFNEGIGGVFKNHAPAGAGKDFIIENAGSWSIDNDIPCSYPTSPAPGKISLVLSSMDVAPVMFYWLGVTVNTKWGWLGSAAWMRQYEVEFMEP